MPTSYVFMNSNNGPHIILLASVKLEARDRFLTKQKFVVLARSASVATNYPKFKLIRVHKLASKTINSRYFISLVVNFMCKISDGLESKSSNSREIKTLLFTFYWSQMEYRIQNTEQTPSQAGDKWCLLNSPYPSPAHCAVSYMIVMVAVISR